MRIRMISLASGPAGTYQPGREYQAPQQLSSELAKAFVACGAAVALPGAGVEVAAIQAPERAVRPRPQRKQGK